MSSAGASPRSVAYLTNSTSTVPKVTYVPLKAPDNDKDRATVAASGGAVRKASFVHSLNLQPREVDAALNPPLPAPAAGTVLPAAGAASGSAAGSAAVRAPDAMTPLLKPFEHGTLASAKPSSASLANTPDSELLRVGRAVLAHRQAALDGAEKPANGAAADPAKVAAAKNAVNAAAVAVNGLDAQSGSATSPIGMLNLERIEMTPAGIERGGLLATIPLAPKERTVVVQQEWSVISQDFTSIVSDSLENYSETGVTDATQIAQSTTSQVAHNNQFNVNASVSGSYGFVTATVATGFATQDQNSSSATQSRQHSVITTQKASSRSIQSHQITIATSTTTGSSMSNSRMLENPSATDPMRIDYFSMMRKWYCALYRYGLRLTYDITIPEPGAAMREVYAQIDQLQKQAAKQFSFDIKHSDITADVKPGDSEPYYLVLADRYSVDAPPPPSPANVVVQVGPVYFSTTDTVKPVQFTVPNNYWINSIIMTNYIGQGAGDGFSVVGGNGQLLTGNTLGVDICAGKTFLYEQSGSFQITLLYQTSAHEDPGEVFFTVNCVPTDTAMAQWRSTVWSALYNAAQSQFYAQQQVVNAEISALQAELASVDTLTLRREENDEIMKGALRWLLGDGFEFMPQDVIKLFKSTAGNQIDYGVDFTGNTSGLSASNWSIAKQNDGRINFINQAIDWDNVIYYVYSYFWDVPEAWNFIREIRHPDATRQAFLRAGAARIVLTVRQGWELAWTYFVEFGSTSMPSPLPSHPYLTIAQQIQDYDQINYPGIPPADPNGGGPIDDGTPQVGTTSTATLAASARQVSIAVTSSTGFVAGATAIIDTYASGVQENAQIVSVPDATHIVVQALAHVHSTATNGNQPYPIVQAGESGLLIAEWFAYTPTSGVDIAVTSNLATIT